MEKTFIYSPVLQDVAEILSGKWTRTLHVRSLLDDEEYWIWDEELENYDVDYLEDDEHVGLKVLSCFDLPDREAHRDKLRLGYAIDNGDRATARRIGHKYFKKEGSQIVRKAFSVPGRLQQVIDWNKEEHDHG